MFFSLRLDMQTFYHENIVGKEPMAPAAQAAPTSSTPPRQRVSTPGDDGVELEWEHQYDVGTATAAAGGGGGGDVAANDQNVSFNSHRKQSIPLFPFPHHRCHCSARRTVGGARVTRRSIFLGTKY